MKPCRKCGVDDRTKDGHCRPCGRERSARPMSPELSQKACEQCGATDRNVRGDCKPCNRPRSQAWRERGVAHLLERPCSTCGATERHPKYGGCIPCGRTTTREW